MLERHLDLLAGVLAQSCSLRGPHWLKIGGHQPAASLPEITAPLDMGKVHGSLARAGKVKNQTPKVAKAEKKKKLTGRAKKRFVYNRRFVSVVKSGPKRGPNSNAGK
eukprot:Skav229580  [mRNA]  locus=scaffold568:849885:851854:+ [translate_table: standard]